MDFSTGEEDSEEGSPLRTTRARSLTPPPDASPSGEAGSTSPPLPWFPAGSRSPSPPHRSASGSRSPSPKRSGGASARSWSRSPSPQRSTTIMARSVRTTRSAPRLAAASGQDQESGEEDTDVEDVIAPLRDPSTRPRLIPPPDGGEGSSASVGGDGTAGEDAGPGTPVLDVAEEVVEGGDGSLSAFSFPQLPAPTVVADAADVLDAFAIREEVRKGKAKVELVEATMGANTGPRTEAIKNGLYTKGRLLDIERLERWLRREEAVHELAWFADLCADESEPAPPPELFESAFRALECASSRELHRGAEARCRRIGHTTVPEFFICPVSRKIMEDPVVISSGKTVDRSALEKWLETNQHICPVTGQVLEHDVSIPNIFIARCILRWRTVSCIAGLAAVTEPPAISAQEEALFKEVTLMPHSPRCSRESYDALRRLHKLVVVDDERVIVHLLVRDPAGTIAKLASVLPETCIEPGSELDDIILGIMEKAASYGPNKAAFGDDRYTIPVLIARTWLGPVPTRARCAHILGLLAEDYCNKIQIGELGGLAAMIDLLSVGDVGVKKTVARAVASLCEAQENCWGRFLKEGVVDSAISLFHNDGLVIEAQAILMQAQGFELAMVQILHKLEALGSVEGRNMAKRFYYSFTSAKPGHRAASLKARYSSASSSDGGFGEGLLEQALVDAQSRADAKVIVSWLQNRCSYPRTYRYRKP